MFNFFLYTIGDEISFGEKMLLGGQVTLLGMGTVFSVLALLWGLVELLHLILKPFSAPKKQKAAEVKTEAPAVEAVSEMDEGEIVAAIVAAISAATGKAPSAFRVVSFKRANRNFASGK